MGEALVKGVARGVDDVGRCIEIRLPNLEMDNIAALCLQRSRLHQNFKSGLGSETRHTLGEAKFAGVSHDAVISLINALAQLVFLWSSLRGGHCVPVDFTNVVATGLRPVPLQFSFPREKDGPQGRGCTRWTKARWRLVDAFNHRNRRTCRNCRCRKNSSGGYL